MMLTLPLDGQDDHPVKSSWLEFLEKPGFFLCILWGYCYTRPRDLFLPVWELGPSYLFTDHAHIAGLTHERRR